MAELTFTILGCGSSGGVPRLGGIWGDCDPENPRNIRKRCSMLVQRSTDGWTWDPLTTALLHLDGDTTICKGEKHNLTNMMLKNGNLS